MQFCNPGNPKGGAMARCPPPLNTPLLLVQFSSVVLFHDLGSIESITYKNKGQEKGRSSKTINVKTCRTSAWLLHHMNTHSLILKYTLSKAEKYIKQMQKKEKNSVYEQFRVNYFKRPATHLTIVMLIIY